MKIVLHSDDFLLLEHWEKALLNKCHVIDDLDKLLKVKDSLIIINYSACNSKCGNILQTLIVSNKVLILHRTPDLQTAKSILTYGAKGYGNALMREHFIVSAVETIKENMIWLYPEFTTMLIEDIPKRNNDMARLNILTDREREVALLLKNGLTYKDIAQKLEITPRTIKAHAQHIYTKLTVKDRLGLALLLK